MYQNFKESFIFHTQCFQAGDFERMWVSFFAGKFPEMCVTPTQCGWVHIYVYDIFCSVYTKWLSHHR